MNQGREGGNHSQSLRKDNQRVARGIGLVALFLLVGKLAAAFKEMAFAYRFGTSEIVDVYLVVFTVSMLFPMIWTVVLGSVFVPYSKKLVDDELKGFVSQMTGISLILGGVFAFLGIILMPVLVPYIWNDFSVDGQQLLVDLFRGLAPAVVAAFLSGQYAAQLLAMEKHSNSLMDGLPSLGLALVLLIFPFGDSKWALIFGSLIGFFLQVIGLALVLRSANSLPAASFGMSSPAWTGFRNAMGIMIGSQLVMSMTYPLDLYFASNIGEGSIATYGYAQRLVLLAMSLGATAVARAVLPVLSDRSNSLDKAKKIARYWTVLLFLLGSIAAIVGWYLTPLVVKLLFERGAFSAADTVNVSELAQMGLTQLPIYFSGMVLSQFVASQQLFRILFQSSVIALIVKFLAAALMTSIWGLNGLMLSSTIMYATTFAFLYWQIRRLTQFSSGVSDGKL